MSVLRVRNHGIERCFRFLVKCAPTAGVVLILLLSIPARATCTGSLVLRKASQPGDTCSLFVSVEGNSPSCSVLPIDVWLRNDDGPFVRQMGCPHAPCVQNNLWDGCYTCLQGVHSVTMEVDCYTTGPDGTCGFGAVRDTPLTITKTFEFDHSPSISGLDAESLAPGQVQGRVKYHAEAADRNNKLLTERLGTSSTPGDWQATGGLDPDYSAVFNTSPSGSDRSTMVLLTVQTCGDKRASAVVSTRDNECPAGGDPAGSSCPACVGKPIRVSNGNMRMTDRDPLPGTDVVALSRTYDSQGFPGLFGNGWTSVFDASIRTYQSQILGTTFLEARTASNSSYLFQNVGGGWVQMWPKGGPSAILTPGAATFTLREPRSPTETIFDASSGRVLRVRSRATGREFVVSYTGGLPSNVSDSWGNWAWTITADTANRIYTISVDGTPLIWTYNRDSGGNLLSVTGPSGAAWRSYTYTGNGLTAAYDARGTLIESHSYSVINGAARATSSISDQDDISSIDYFTPGRNDAEYVTRTTSATGATTDYYTRMIGGRPRTVQVVGHCASCGTDDAVYGFEPLSGHLIREQNARGYITVREYDHGRRSLSAGGLRSSNRCRALPPDARFIAHGNAHAYRCYIDHVVRVRRHQLARGRYGHFYSQRTPCQSGKNRCGATRRRYRSDHATGHDRRNRQPCSIRSVHHHDSVV
jgi:hypothetical protein